MLVFEGFIHEEIGRGDEIDMFGNKPSVYTEVFVLDYCLTDHYLALKIADNNYLNCGDVYLLRHEGYDQEFKELMRGIHAIHQDGSITVAGVEDFKYKAECEWRMEYGGYFIKKLTPIMESYLEVTY